MAKLDIKCCPICCAPVKAIETCNSVRFEYDGPRWISVEERLPEAHKNVLVYATSPIGWWNVEIDWMDEQGWVCNADSEWHTITYWMPLPQPPEEPA